MDRVIFASSAICCNIYKNNKNSNEHYRQASNSSGRKMLPSLVIFLCVGLLPAVLCFDGLQGQSIKDAFGEFSLTDMISVQSQGIEYEEADDGFPSYKFFSTSDVKSSYRVLLPEKLYEFAILVKFLPNSPKGGYLFSVVNPLDTVVQLGLHLSPVIKNVWNVSLLYTQSDQNSISRKLVSYQLPYRGKEWTTLSFQVLGDKVLFYYDCELNKTTSVVREPQELVFDSASTLYLAQAGLILTGHFEVSDFGCDLLFAIVNLIKMPSGKVHMLESEFEISSYFLISNGLRTCTYFSTT
ncbi:uncharacterized protein LOC128861819 [Anastrepha ludens]|uniref:uncharacterized protein LOC128861819 n=1 Tax=Anastrepha ludens TaxID=28586 RepID=UPI0023B054CD|nr:uncharacterized protein LOC128861819 [Anastrepha ludens]